MTRRDRELSEIAAWADRHGVTNRHELLDALYAADLDYEDLPDLEREIETIEEEE